MPRQGESSGEWWRIAVALILAVGPVWGAWVLAGGQFDAAPRLVSPGTILIVSEMTTTPATRPVTVNVHAGVGRSRLGMIISITQGPATGTIREPALPVLVFLCGRIAQDPQFTDNRGRPLPWVHPTAEMGSDWSSLINGSLSTCVYSRQSLPEGIASGRRQVMLLGSSDAPSTSVSGARVLYRVPGVTTAPFVRGLSVAALPAGSTARVDLAGFPGDLTDAVASPQLPDEGVLSWTADFGGPRTPALDYRLSGTLQDTLATQQRDLFIAGSLVGVAGGAVVWLIELAMDKATASKSRRAARHRPQPPTDDRETANGSPAGRDDTSQTENPRIGSGRTRALTAAAVILLVVLAAGRAAAARRRGTPSASRSR